MIQCKDIKGLQVHHKDEVKINNTADNLECVTGQYNTEFSKAKHYRLRSPEGIVLEVFNPNNLCRENGLYGGCMIKVFQGKRSYHKGYIAL